MGKTGRIGPLVALMAVLALCYGADKNGVITGSSAHDKITLLEAADTPDPFSPELTNATFTGVFQVKRTDGLGSEDNEHPDKFRFFIRHTLVISNALNYQEVNTLTGETNVIAPPKEKGKDGDKKYFSVTVAQLWNGLDAQGNIVTDGAYQYALTGELYREKLNHKGNQDEEPKVKLIGASNSLAGTISVDTAPPVISTIPAQNAVIAEHTPVIVVNYADASGVDLSTLKIIFNDIDLTSQFSVTASQATYQIPEKLSDGLYTISATIKDILGHTASLTTTFSVVSAVGVVTPAGGGTVEVTEAGSPLINSAIEIPPGAVTQDITAVISEPLPADVPPPPAGTTIAGPAVELDTQPQITFTSPITIKIPYSEALVTAAGGNEANVKLLKFDTALNQWVNIPATVDAANNLVVAQVTSLSVFQAVIPTTQTVTKTEYGSIVEISGPVQVPVDTDYHIVLSATTSAPIYQWSLKQNNVVVAGQGFVFGNTLYRDITFNKSVAGDYIYLFSFRGVSGAHGWPPYTTVSITVTVVPTIPNAPSDLAATAVSATQIALTWTDNSNNEQGFKIESKLNNWGDFVQIATVGADTTSYSTTRVLTGINHTYRVRAFNITGNSDYSNTASATPPGDLTYDEKTASGYALITVFRPSDYNSVTIAAQETPTPYEPYALWDNEGRVSETTEGILNLYYTDSIGQSVNMNRIIAINNITRVIYYNDVPVTTLQGIFGELSPVPVGDSMALLMDFPYWVIIAMSPVGQNQPQASTISFKTDKPRDIATVHKKPRYIPPELIEQAYRDLSSQGLTPTGTTRVITPTTGIDTTYNCYGWIFTCGNDWLNDNPSITTTQQLDMIRQDNGYITYTYNSPAQVGDIIVYRDAKGKITHMGLVREVDPVTKRPKMVESKWSELPQYKHAPKDVPREYLPPDNPATPEDEREKNMELWRTDRTAPPDSKDPDKVKHTLKTD